MEESDSDKSDEEEEGGEEEGENGEKGEDGEDEEGKVAAAKKEKEKEKKKQKGITILCMQWYVCTIDDSVIRPFPPSSAGVIALPPLFFPLFSLLSLPPSSQS